MKKYVSKCDMNGLSEETVKTVVSDYLMGKGTFCILRRVEVASDEVIPAVAERPLGIFGRIKRKIGRLFNNH